ncbi:MAG TPA: outer membrane lipoprotein carrier protein LolA [Bacteroidales bacterium]|nr:outer membrane lipoprotein carrier protein LolA [Bacteroidales bacterium]
MTTTKQLLTIIIVVLGLSATAQVKKASAILDKATEKISSYNTLKIEFNYSMENKSQGIHETFSGTLISKGDKYRIEVAGQQIISDGVTVWTYLESVSEVKINTVEEGSEGFSPTGFLLNWKNNYKPVSFKEGENHTTVVLHPIHPSTFNRVEIELTNATNDLRAIRLSDASGNQFSYIVNKLTPNVATKDTDFVFDAKRHPNVEVIDLR